jgi:tetratricopeptide (TPR) repeat protein
LQVLEYVLENAQGQDRELELVASVFLGRVYQDIGQPQQALRKFEETLSIARAMDNRALAATILNNIGTVYQATGQPQLALQKFEEALPITREVGNRAGEATTLNSMGLVYQGTGQPQLALQKYQEALPITREVGNRALESTAHSNIAVLLYMHYNRQQEAITSMQRAIAILVEAGLPQDGAGQKVDDLQSLLQIMQSEIPLGGQARLSPVELQKIIDITIFVMTTAQDQRPEWREAIVEALQDAQQQGADWQIEADFFTAVLAILDGRSLPLPADHPYVQALAAIQDGIAKSGQQS